MSINSPITHSLKYCLYSAILMFIRRVIAIYQTKGPISIRVISPITNSISWLQEEVLSLRIDVSQASISVAARQSIISKILICENFHSHGEKLMYQSHQNSSLINSGDNTRTLPHLIHSPQINFSKSQAEHAHSNQVYFDWVKNSLIRRWVST